MELSYLSGLSAAEFEFERCKLISAELDRAPTPEARIKALNLQMVLDQRRETMSREQFIASIFADITQNLENMSDQFVSMKNTIYKK